MQIKELYIKNFGKFTSRTFSFEPGINLIYGENESGKTTLHTFIKSVFYGLKRMRGRASGKDVFSRYEPWDNPGYYAGNIRFRCGNKVFRLERDFRNQKKDGELICETDGERMSLEDGDLDMLLGGTGEVVFENTVYIRQLQSRTDEGLAAELKNYIANYRDGDSTVDVQESLQLLKIRKKELEKKRLEAQKSREEQKGKLYSRIQYAQEEIKKNQDEWKGLELRCRELENKKFRSDDKKITDRGKKADEVERPKTDPPGEGSRKKRVLSVLIPATAGTGILWFNFQREVTASMSLSVAGIVLLLAAAGILVYRFWKKRTENGDRKGRYGKAEQNTADECDRNVKKEEIAGREKEQDQNPEYIRWSMGRLEKEIHEKELQIENLQEEIRSITDGADRSMQKNLEAIALAASYITETVKDMQVYVGKQLKMRTSEILSELTEGKYTSVELDENFQPGVHSSERYIPLEQLSRGTMEQVYFSLRMAAGEILCQEEELPVILDDVFAMYDEERLGRSLKWLDGQKRQVLIFTCHKREEEILRKLGIPFHRVQM